MENVRKQTVMRINRRCQRGRDEMAGKTQRRDPKGNPGGSQDGRGNAASFLLLRTSDLTRYLLGGLVERRLVFRDPQTSPIRGILPRQVNGVLSRSESLDAGSRLTSGWHLLDSAAPLGSRNLTSIANSKMQQHLTGEVGRSRARWKALAWDLRDRMVHALGERGWARKEVPRRGDVFWWGMAAGALLERWWTPLETSLDQAIRRFGPGLTGGHQEEKEEKQAKG